MPRTITGTATSTIRPKVTCEDNMRALIAAIVVTALIAVPDRSYRSPIRSMSSVPTATTSPEGSRRVRVGPSRAARAVTTCTVR